MRRKGYTLVELIASLAIISIIFTIGFGGVKIYNDIAYEIEKKHLFYEIEDILSYGKKYLSEENKDGVFCIEDKGDTINVSVKVNDVSVREVELEKCISLYYENYIEQKSLETLVIKSNGNIEAKTIYFQDKNGDRDILTVAVSGNYTSIREWKKE
ncbi:prepilin-type N-terminal cleavage/methylation domain-containing protein [Clostridium vincentii]|uniref:Prepilin-type N-terminal cleavage/methylation domain-containing protein n=1 Tax=Clostridium vincentii TaxID=52704 RepID=A0A2T0BGF9_9CLOT|nr:prepilin-type N-terminal cleavage/methylation domain-containing protein [Clostridium vincentii]PRR82944.1 hypothetical protein CLVI_13870 [Clostridium vincentii]